MLFGLLFVIMSGAAAQTHDWLWVTGNNPGVSNGYSIARDSLDNIYVTGEFQGTATFGSSTITSLGSWDIFVAKLDRDGNWLWASRAGGTDVEWGEGIAVDNSGNVYIIGSFYATAVFGTTSLTSA
jgi:hypothetical protein